jgi:poly(A) polymerase
MNALYADRQGSVIDPLDGLPDLQARRVRFVGDAETRIREDYLRILRFFRFHAVYGDPDQGIDPGALAACAALSAGLETISKERVGAEMRKLLAAADPAPALAAMTHAGILARILPGADPRAVGPLVHLDPRADWLCRLAALGGDDPATQLRLSKTEAGDLSDLRDAVGSMETPAALGWRLGQHRGWDAMLLRAALMDHPIPQGAKDEVARGAASRFPITAADLMPVLQGEALGARLKELERKWLASDLTLSREELLKGA